MFLAACSHTPPAGIEGPDPDLAVLLAAKAAAFEEAIDRFHRRPPGFVNAVHLDRPYDASSFRQNPSDNDGLWTSLYGASQCFRYAATREPAAAARARAAFEALRLLVAVTQGGSHPAPPGFPARTVVPADGPDPNVVSDPPEKDARRRRDRDPRWKVLSPRWPLSADGRWHWKCDTSSDELDGHFFFYAAYHEHVADEAEKVRVRETACAVMDHLFAHGFRLVDWDGRPTRWADFSPESLNHDPAWADERALNSLSILAYLAVAHRVSGEARYREIALDLVRRHGYADNVALPKPRLGTPEENHSDDQLAFLGFYHLVRLEPDPELRRRYSASLHEYWRHERPERNPFFNLLHAGACGCPEARGGPARDETVDALLRFPADRIRRPLRNSGRPDIRPLPPDAAGRPRGSLPDGRALPANRRWISHWNHDPWILDDDGDGTEMADGSAFLIAYYLGLHLGFALEP